LGDTLDLGVPSDDTVGAAQIKADLISGTTALAAEPADTDEFLVSDAGVLKRIDYSLIKGGGITEADMFRLTAETGNGTNAVISANLERVDDATFSKIGTGMTQSSGVFTFPSTGLYEVTASPMILADDDANAYVKCDVSSDGTNFDEVLRANGGNTGETHIVSVVQSTLVNVTNATNFKVKFSTESFSNASRLMASSNFNQTTFKFIRLGDSQ